MCAWCLYVCARGRELTLQSNGVQIARKSISKGAWVAEHLQSALQLSMKEVYSRSVLRMQLTDQAYSYGENNRHTNLAMHASEEILRTEVSTALAAVFQE